MSSSIDSYKYSVCANYTAIEQDEVELIGNPYMFTARRYDIEILRPGSGQAGLYYYRARYYNPYIGRFLQIDPAYQGMNWYSYCGNNPLNCTDPSGLYSRTCYIPLQTVWHRPSTGEYDTPEQHKIDVNSFLEDAKFYESFPGVTLEKVEYKNFRGSGRYKCTFEVPDEYENMRMKIKLVKNIPILNVITGGRFFGKSTTQIVDWRIVGMLSDPAYVRKYIKPVGGYIAWGLAKVVIGVIAWNIPVIGPVAGTVMAVWGVIDFITLITLYRKNIPNIDVIEDLVDTYEGLENILGKYYAYKDQYHL